MILQRFVGSEVHDVLRKRKALVIGLRRFFSLGTRGAFRVFLCFGVFISRRLVIIQKVGVIDDDLAFLLIIDCVEERVDRQRLVEFREPAIRSGGVKLFHRVFIGRSCKLRITERLAVRIQAVFRFQIRFAEFLYGSDEFLRGILAVGVVHILRFRRAVPVFA